MWHVLALALGGRTVDEWKSVMTQPEFLAWREFHRLYPFDDLHRYHRPAALVASTRPGLKDAQASYDKNIEFLQPDPRNHDMTDADIATMRAFGFKGK
jgi:hypothetical protein